MGFQRLPARGRGAHHPAHPGGGTAPRSGMDRRAWCLGLVPPAFGRRRPELDGASQNERAPRLAPGLGGRYEEPAARGLGYHDGRLARNLGGALPRRGPYLESARFTVATFCTCWAPARHCFGKRVPRVLDGRTSSSDCGLEERGVSRVARASLECRGSWRVPGDFLSPVGNGPPLERQRGRGAHPSFPLPARTQWPANYYSARDPFLDPHFPGGLPGEGCFTRTKPRKPPRAAAEKKHRLPVLHCCF